ncbi:MAG: pyruvate carboxylase [Bacteroidia bacterium]
MFKKILVANRGEIAIRIFRTCTELGITTVAIYTHEDRYSLHRYKADESYQIGKNEEPLKPYLDKEAIILLAKKRGVDAIHPGYGFLSENAQFARMCRENGITFIGPDPEIMDALGNKVQAKKLAVENNIPIIESSKTPLDSFKTAVKEANAVGYPIMLKAASGGGGRGMRVVRDNEELKVELKTAQGEALKAFGDDTIFIEKFIENPKHIEVQIVGDKHGNMVHLFERDCSVQRRYQKVIEIAPSVGLSDKTKEQLYNYATGICKAVNYNNIGTVEFLIDSAQNVYFIEVNPRIQVEHTVTEEITGLDLVKTQIFIASGKKLQDHEINIPAQNKIQKVGFALQCRITTEDPKNDFKPDYGIVQTYRSAAGLGIRLDAGNIYPGAKVSPFFDSMLVKISAHSWTLSEAINKMNRALKEFRVRGVNTNIQFLQNLLKTEQLSNGTFTVNYINDHPELFNYAIGRDRASRMLQYIGEVTVNGNPDVKYTDPNIVCKEPKVPEFDLTEAPKKGTKQLLTELGPKGFSEWLKKEKKVHFTDTTMRDAHQSLLATRMRSFDMMKVAKGYARHHHNMFSVEMWGGATFDVCLRFLHEDPWERLALLRKAIPNVLFQMLLRGSNGVGYTAYPDNLIEKFIEVSWENGMDIFRIFDSLNWMPAMAPAIEFVRTKTKGLAEGSLSYTGDILNPKRTKYDLKYYIQLAKDLENAGAHILAIKDMAGLLKPYAAYELVSALKSETNLPVHLHTHDTSSIQSATYLKAIEAGVDVVDGALGGMSGLTSQPNLNALVEMLKFNSRENALDIDKLNEYSNYWSTVREYYYPFESGLKAGTAEVYKHEIPGGQYSNLKPQAEGLGLGNRFTEITDKYAEVNKMFGDIVKVTPSSKVVGDMALFMMNNDLTAQDVIDKGESLSFPESVQNFFYGSLGQPVGGFPDVLQKVILKGKNPITNRPNEHLKPIDFEADYADFEKEFKETYRSRGLRITDFLSFKLYPKVFRDFRVKRQNYSNLRNLPTKTFFYGMKEGEEIEVNLGEGKNVLIELLSIGPANSNGEKQIYFSVNGQTRAISVTDNSLAIEKSTNRKANDLIDGEVGSPLQGLLSQVFVKAGDNIEKNEPLFLIEAMKMETTVTSTVSGVVKAIYLSGGTLVESGDLVVEIE